MTGTEVVLVAAAGAVGALVRHELTSTAADGLVVLHVVNALGALALGLVVGVAGASPVALTLAAGGLGSLTSFSSWVVGADGRSVARHLVLPAAVAVVAAAAGLVAGDALGAVR